MKVIFFFFFTLSFSSIQSYNFLTFVFCEKINTLPLLKFTEKKIINEKMLMKYHCLNFISSSGNARGNS